MKITNDAQYQASLHAVEIQRQIMLTHLQITVSPGLRFQSFMKSANKVKEILKDIKDYENNK